MKRYILMLTCLFLALFAINAAAKEKLVKVYIHAPDRALNESFALYLQTWMRALDEEDKSYKLVWSERATDADFIITVFMDKDPDSCKYMAVTLLQKPESGKNYETMNVQLKCDPNQIGKSAAEALEVAMGLKQLPLNP